MAFFSRGPSSSTDPQSPGRTASQWEDPSSISVLKKLKPPSFVQDLFKNRRVNSLPPEEVSRTSVDDLAAHGGQYSRSETPVSLSAGWQEADQKPIIRRLLKPENRLYTREEYENKVRTVSAEYLKKSFFPTLTEKEKEFAEIVALRAIYNVRLNSKARKHSRVDQSSAANGQTNSKPKTELQIDGEIVSQLSEVFVKLKSQTSGQTISVPLNQAYEVIVKKSASARAQMSDAAQGSNERWRIQGFDLSRLPNESAQLIQITSLVNVFQDHSIRKGPLRYIPSAWLAQVMAGYVQMDLPIPFGLPVFPRKVQSGVKSRMSVHPDAGEASTLARLNGISHALNLLYPPIGTCNSQDFAERTLTQRRGSFAVAFLDGELFLDCSNVPESTVRDYEQDLQDMASLMGILPNVVLRPFRDVEKLVPKQFIEKRDKLIQVNERKWNKATLPILERFFPSSPTGSPHEGDLKTALERVIAKDPSRNQAKKPRGVFEDVFLARLFSLKYECIEQYCTLKQLDQAEFEVSFFKGIFDKQEDPEVEKLRWQVVRECWNAQIKFLALVDARKVVDPLSLIDPSLLKLDYARTLAEGSPSSKRLEVEYSERNFLTSLTRRVTQLLSPESVFPGFGNLSLNNWEAILPDGTPLLQQIWGILLRCSIHAKPFHIGLNSTTSSERTYQSWQGVPFLRRSYRDGELRQAPGRHGKSDLTRDFDVVLDGTFAIEVEGGLGGYPLLVSSSSDYQELQSGDPRRYLERLAKSGQVFLYVDSDPGSEPHLVEGDLTSSLNKLDRQRSKGGKGSSSKTGKGTTTLVLAGSDKLPSLSDATRDIMGSSEATYLPRRIGWTCRLLSESLLSDLDPHNSSEVVMFSALADDFDGLPTLAKILNDLSSQNTHFSDWAQLQSADSLETIKEAFQSSKLLRLVQSYRQDSAFSASSERPKVLAQDTSGSSEELVERTHLDKPTLHIISQLRGLATEIGKLGVLLTEATLEEALLYIHKRKLVERSISLSEQIMAAP